MRFCCQSLVAKLHLGYLFSHLQNSLASAKALIFVVPFTNLKENMRSGGIGQFPWNIESAGRINYQSMNKSISDEQAYFYLTGTSITVKGYEAFY
jgi:hypothetical protein